MRTPHGVTVHSDSAWATQQARDFAIEGKLEATLA